MAPSIFASVSPRIGFICSSCLGPQVPSCYAYPRVQDRTYRPGRPGRVGQDMTAPLHQAGLPITEAAKHLGVTTELLRKRAQRGTIPAYKADGRWFVVLDQADDPVQDSTRDQAHVVLDEAQMTGQDSVPIPPGRGIAPAAMSQLEAIRDEWLQPLIDQLKTQATQIGRLEVERDQAIAQMRATIRERDLLQQAAEMAHAAEEQLKVVIAERNDAYAEVELLRQISQVTKASEETDVFMTLTAPEAMETSSDDPSEASFGAMAHDESLNDRSRMSGLMRRVFRRS